MSLETEILNMYATASGLREGMVIREGIKRKDWKQTCGKSRTGDLNEEEERKRLWSAGEGGIKSPLFHYHSFAVKVHERCTYPQGFCHNLKGLSGTHAHAQSAFVKRHVHTGYFMTSLGSLDTFGIITCAPVCVSGVDCALRLIISSLRSLKSFLKLISIII